MSAEAQSAARQEARGTRAEAGVEHRQGKKKESSKKRRAAAAAAARAEPAPSEQRGSSASSGRSVDMGDVDE